MMRIALLDERPAAECDLASGLASALDASVMRFCGLAEARRSPEATAADAVVARCSERTADPVALIGEIRAIWGKAPLILVSSAGADNIALSAASPQAEAWIGEGAGCELRAAAAVRRAIEQRLRSPQLETFNTAGGEVNYSVDVARTLDTARQQWEDTVDAIDEAISIQDSSHTILRANRAFMRLMGPKGGAVIGAKCHSVICGVDEPPQDAPCQRLLRGERPGTMEVQPPGTECQLVGSIYPLRDAEGNLDGVVHVLRNVTEERRLQAQIARAEKLVAIGELTAGIAHELNNPLTAVGGLADLLARRSESLPQAVRGDLSTIAQQAARAGRIVHNLLAFSRQTLMAMQPVDVRVCLRESLELFGYQFRTDNISVASELDPNLPCVLGDSDRLQQVIVNLLSNARHALGQVGGGVLTVRTSADERSVRLEVADTGPGIAQQHLGRVFDPFFTTKQVGEGTGLGLSISHGIVAEHAGKIELTNRPGGGVLAVVELPRAAQPAQAPPLRDPEGLPSEPTAAAAPSPARVLVVDDEPLLRHFILHTLETAGHGVTAAENAEQAVDLLGRETFDIVLCDLKMLDAEGRDLCQTLMNERADLAGRIIFWAGESVRPSARAFLNEAGARYLLKPFTAQQLLQAVEQGLRAGPRSRDRISP